MIGANGCVRMRGMAWLLSQGRYMTASGHAGASPSGKAAAFDAAIRRFESCRPSQIPVKAFILLANIMSAAIRCALDCANAVVEELGPVASPQHVTAVDTFSVGGEFTVCSTASHLI